MEFEIARSEFLKALNKVLRGFKNGAAGHGRLSLDQSQLTSAFSKRTVTVAVKSRAPGTVWLPAHLMFWLRRVDLESNANFMRVKISVGYIRVNDLIRDHETQITDQNPGM
jgi:hypothetical protein